LTHFNLTGDFKIKSTFIRKFVEQN